MNNNKHLKIHLEALEEASKAFQVLKDFKINLDKETKEEELVNLEIYLKNLRNFLEEHNNNNKVEEDVDSKLNVEKISNYHLK